MLPEFLSFSPRGEGTLEISAARIRVLSPLEERDRVRGSSAASKGSNQAVPVSARPDDVAHSAGFHDLGA